MYISQDQTKKFFQLDPEFPSRLRTSGYASTWNFLRSILEDYSQRKITVPSDRATAIAGLLDRIGKELPCYIHHGIIEWYLHRTLLWRRATDTTTGEASRKIEYKSPVPSWSWMAYAGPVVFLNDAFGQHNTFRGLQFDQRTVRTIIWEVTDPGIRCRRVEEGANVGYQSELYGSKGIGIGFITFDEENNETVQVSTVAIMAERTASETASKGTVLQYFVLFIGRRTSPEGGYQRFGMGVLDQDCRLKSLGEDVIF